MPEATMHETDRRPIVTIALLAAMADGERGPEEQEQLRRIAATAGGEDVAALGQQIQAGQVKLDAVVGQLSGDEARRLAYEMAVCVCNADGVANEREQAFLSQLRAALRLEPVELEQHAQALASAPLPGPPLEVGAPQPRREPLPSQAGIPAMTPDEALDEMILDQAIITGALELLPQGLATLAIVPLQLRLVYRIGSDYGQKMDANQIKDLAAAMGLGAAGQVLEGVARKVLGGVAQGLFGGLFGGVAGGVAGAAVGAASTFATTYALGHAAKQYYSQGRRLSLADLQALVARLREEAKGIFPKVQQRIEGQARNLDLRKLVGSLRGEGGSQI